MRYSHYTQTLIEMQLPAGYFLGSSDRIWEEVTIMNSIKTLLGIIATEAAEDHVESIAPAKQDEPRMEYSLELIRKPDGSLLWVE